MCNFSCSTPSLALDTISLNFGHSCGFIAMIHSSIYLYFLVYWCSVYFLMLTSHLYTFFNEMSIQISPMFFYVFLKTKIWTIYFRFSLSLSLSLFLKKKIFFSLLPNLQLLEIPWARDRTYATAVTQTTVVNMQDP